MKKLWMAILAAGLFACNDSAESKNETSDTGMRPRDVNEAVTNSTRIVNDSVIVPDTHNLGPNPSAGVDTIGPMRKRNNNNNP